MSLHQNDHSRTSGRRRKDPQDQLARPQQDEIPVISKPIKLGDRGNQVIWLQEQLNADYQARMKQSGKQAHVKDLLNVDGKFGHNTQLRLRDFQDRNNLDQERGIAGNRTLSTLSKLQIPQGDSDSSDLRQPTPARYAQSATVLKTPAQIKQALNDFYSSNWNYQLAPYRPPQATSRDSLGNKTVNGMITGFQVAQGLPVTGQLDRNTLLVLAAHRNLKQPLVGLPVLAKGGTVLGRSEDIPAIKLTDRITVNEKIAPSAAGMLKELKEHGFGWQASNSFRPNSTQALMRAEWEAGMRSTYVAEAGKSRHEAAAAIDFDLSAMGANSSERYREMSAIASKYGWNTVSDPGERHHFQNTDYARNQIAYDPATGLRILYNRRGAKTFASR